MRSGSSLKLIPDPCTVLSFPGERVKVELSLVTDGPTGLDLVETGRFDIRQMIQSYADLTDMSYIMARLAAGDASVLAENGHPLYGDFSTMPYDHREVVQTVMDARAYFDHLPAEKQAKFDNDFAKWISTAGSLDWVNAMSGNVDKPVDKPVEDDKKEETN